MELCMICKQMQPPSVDSYYRYKDETLTKLRGWVCGVCAKKEKGTIKRALKYSQELKEQSDKLF